MIYVAVPDAKPPTLHSFTTWSYVFLSLSPHARYVLNLIPRLVLIEIWSVSENLYYFINIAT
jgi:hypothetical protein